VDPEEGDVVGFGGRIMEEAVKSEKKEEENVVASSPAFVPAKYINSPESILFHKKDLLFWNPTMYSSSSSGDDDADGEDEDELAGANHVQDSAKKNTIIVEGYFDVIALASIGIHNVVATMGTAISKEQLQLAAKGKSKWSPIL